MRDFGVLNLTSGEDSFRVYVSIIGGELFFGKWASNHPPYADGKVSVVYDGVHAGTAGSLDTYIYDRVKSYLIDSGYIVVSGDTAAGECMYKFA